MTRFKGEVLREMRREQLALAEKVVLVDDFEDLGTVGGMDVAYEKSTGTAYSACAVFDHITGEHIGTTTASSPIPMPYIPTYLSFREIPPMEKVLASTEESPSILMVDGNGVLHPLGIGLASHLGVKLDVPTIGVAKKLLLGELADDPDPGGPPVEVLIEGEPVAHALIPNTRCSRPIYISSGHRVSSETALRVVRRYSRYRVPEPVRRAHLDCTARRNEARGNKKC